MDYKSDFCLVEWLLLRPVLRLNVIINTTSSVTTMRYINALVDLYSHDSSLSYWNFFLYHVSVQVFSNSDEAPINKKLPKELLLR